MGAPFAVPRHHHRCLGDGDYEADGVDLIRLLLDATGCYRFGFVSVVVCAPVRVFVSQFESWVQTRREGVQYCTRMWGRGGRGAGR